MKIAMALTLDGLVRALRSRAHGLADEVEAGYRRENAEPRRQARKPDARRETMGDRDDVARG